MPFAKGHKFGKGRPKGKENYLTAEAKEMLKEVLTPHLTPEKFNEHLENVHKSQRLSVIAKLLPFIIPKHSSIETDMFSSFTPEQISEILTQLAKDNEHTK